VVPRDGSGAEFASHLAGELDEPASVRTSTITFASLLDLPALSFPEPYLIFADPRAGRVLVMRPSDRTVLLRAIDEATARESPYALAVAAAELLRLARASETLPNLEPPPTSEARPSPRLALGTTISVGVAITEAFGHEPLLVQPTFALALDLIETESELFSTIALAIKAPYSSDRSFGDTLVRYRRWDAALLVGVGAVVRSSPTSPCSPRSRSARRSRGPRRSQRVVRGLDETIGCRSGRASEVARVIISPPASGSSSRLRSGGRRARRITSWRRRSRSRRVSSGGRRAQVPSGPGGESSQ
jgi:hypothetical protein